MATNPFLETPRFPDNITFGATVGPTYQTVVTPIYSGREGRIVAWTQAKTRFEVGMRTMNAATTQTLDAFFRSVKGRAYGFRVKDWTDFSDGGNGVMLQTATPGQYQMGKVYSSQGALSETRMIQKPVPGTVAIYLNGTAQTLTGGGGVAYDTTQGTFTFDNAIQGSSVTAIAVGATTTITCASVLTGIVAGDTLWMSNVTGAGAALLNGLPFDIISVSGHEYTINANTTGATVDAVADAATYVNPTDVFVWTGQFDVPVRFDVDEMKKQVMDRNGPSGDLLVDWGSIPLIEVRI